LAQGTATFVVTPQLLARAMEAFPRRVGFGGSALPTIIQ
jgi:hypothetical protein